MTVIEQQDILGAKILVVDDVLDNVEMLTALLGFAGFEKVEGTTDPFAVAPRHQANDYDLILLDIQMPGIDGFEVMRRLREIDMEPCLPVIALTAHHDYKNRVIESGARDFIRKPFEFREVTQRIKNAVEARLLYKKVSGADNSQPESAGRDAVTQLYNRAALIEQIAQATPPATPEGISALLVLDIEGMAHVAQTEGANCAHWIMKEVAARLVGTARGNDVVARLGATEFALLLPNLPDETAARNTARALLDLIEKPFLVDQGKQIVQLFASVGLSMCPAHVGELERLLDQGIAATAIAKARGGRCVEIAP